MKAILWGVTLAIVVAIGLVAYMQPVNACHGHDAPDADPPVDVCDTDACSNGRG